MATVFGNEFVYGYALEEDDDLSDKYVSPHLPHPENQEYYVSVRL